MHTTLKRVKYKDYDCWLERSYYEDGGRIALFLTDAQNGEPVAVCSINIPEIKLADDEICIKNYSENEGMLDFLVKEGIVHDTGKSVQSGYVSINICKLAQIK